MAKADKKSDKTSDTGSKITRIKAKSSQGSKTAPAEVKASKKRQGVIKPRANKRASTASAGDQERKGLWGYITGSWSEIKQVHWPDRKATWAMTWALVGFTAGFVLIVVLLDYGLAQLFDLIIGK